MGELKNGRGHGGDYGRSAGRYRFCKFAKILVGLCSDRMCGLLGLGSQRITGFIKELSRIIQGRDLGILLGIFRIGFWS